MRRRSAVGAVVTGSLAAAVALLLVTGLISEIADVPTWHSGIHSDTWTPTTGVSALFLGSGAFHGSLEVGPVAFGWLVVVVTSLLVGGLGAALLVFALGWEAHPLAAVLFGMALGLAAEIAIVNLLLNWLQAENGVYRSLPSWGWWVGMGAWGATLGFCLSRGLGKEPAPPAARREVLA
jgi:hypothetical protein